MDVEEITTRLARRFGPGVAQWCAAVPALAAELAARWGLTLGAPFPAGASSVALRCRLPDGTPAALKLSPDREFLAEQAAMLRLFAPSGRVPAVLATEPHAVLMQAVRPGTPVDELPQLPGPQQWAALMAALHAVDQPAHPLPGLRARCEEFYARIGRRLADPAIGARISNAIWNRAMDRCHTLLATERTRVPLHGDLHLGNVLDGGPARGLVAIDPKVHLGDPCFDAVDYVLDAAGQDGVPARCDALAGAYGLDPDRLHDWCRAVAPVIAVSLVPIADAEPAVAELLSLAR
jgi:streptomycin 6-kinase